MAKKKVAKKSVKTKVNTKHLVTYVVNCTPQAQLFDSKRAMDKFIKNFKVVYPDDENGTFLDLCVTDILGEAFSLDQQHDVFANTK